MLSQVQVCHTPLFMSQILFSHSLEILADELATQLAQGDLFSPSLIIIPHPLMKEWLQLELCKRLNSKAILGLRFSIWQLGVQQIAKGLPTPSRAELFGAIWISLQKNPPLSCQPFLMTERKALDFASQLASLFMDYSLYGLPAEESWQKTFFKEVFERHSWIPFHRAIEQANNQYSGALYLFAIDFLPPAVHQFFWRQSNVSVFRFSPCAMFWEDLRSSSERKAILKKWKRNRAPAKGLQALEAMLRESQPLLSNWGMVGRKMSEQPFGDEALTFENYEFNDQCKAALQGLKLDLLLLQNQGVLECDDSIRLIQAGASKLREVQLIRDEIFRLVAKGFSFSDIRVYAPDIKIYAPLIEFVFSDEEQPIPFRIEGLDLSCQSPFYQALLRLFDCVTGRWEAKDLIALFETPSFYRKAGWKSEDLEQVRTWISHAQVRWGLNAEHREAITTENVDAKASSAGSWEEGFDRLIDSWIFLDPEEEDFASWSNLELFEAFSNRFDLLRRTLLSWRKERSLKEWADEIAQLAKTYLVFDEELESDRSAQKDFLHFLDTLRKTLEEYPFPFSFVQKLFEPSKLGVKGGALLHAVRCSSLEPGAVLPARALFLLEMDEESFPRIRPALHPNIIQQSEWDRYLFLEAIFSAQEQLIFSYGHRSKEDGKAVSPSLLIQELYSYLNSPIPKEASFPSSPIDPRCFQGEGVSMAEYRAAQATGSRSLLVNSLKVPDLAVSLDLSLKELTRFIRHPFQEYLQEVLGIEWKEEAESNWKEFELSPLLKHQLLQKSLKGEMDLERNLPLGLFGEEARRNLLEQASEYQKHLQEWNIDSAKIHSLEAKQSLRVGDISVRLTGEAQLAVPGGALYMGHDSIQGMLRRWPELLCILSFNSSHQIYCLRSGKLRNVADPLTALQSIVELYFRCRHSPLFLHPDWADALLRKGMAPERDTEDRILKWALQRSPALDLEQEQKIWQDTLQKAFSSFIALFPTRRGAHAEV